MDLSTFGDGSELLVELERYVRTNGLMSLLAGFDGAGAEEAAESWVGTGANRPVGAGEVKRAMGRDALAGMAARLGTGSDEVAEGLARLLPSVVDALTPGGTLPSGADLDALDLGSVLSGADVAGLLR